MFRPLRPAAQALRSVAWRYRVPHARTLPAGWDNIGTDVRRVLTRVIARPASENAALRDVRLARLEAVLFLSHEPMSSRKLAQFASLADGTEARTLVRRLNQRLDASGYAFRVEEVAGGFQMLTRPKFGSWLRRLFPTPVETRLSGPALETLAVTAYRQPVLRAEIEAIRGVQCGEVLRQLMERDLVRIVGRSSDLGHPFLYGTTRKFLQVFGLRHLDELPRAAHLRVRVSPPGGNEPVNTVRETAER